MFGAAFFDDSNCQGFALQNLELDNFEYNTQSGSSFVLEGPNVFTVRTVEGEDYLSFEIQDRQLATDVLFNMVANVDGMEGFYFSSEARLSSDSVMPDDGGVQ